MTSPAVSIVIPLYNKGPWIRRSLDSIAAQTFSDFELIVVDDGSSDEGAAIVRDYGDPRFQLISQPNAGPGAARNRGIAAAQAEYVAFLDADDEWMPSYLESSLGLLVQYGPDVASLSSGYIEYPSGIDRSPLWIKRGITQGVFRLTTHTDRMQAVHRLAYMSPWSTLVRTSVLRRWGGFFDRNRCLYAEDAYLWLKILLNHPVAFHLQPLVRFHVEASELSKNLKGARPVEPFLTHPAEIRSVCPPALQNVLEDMLAIRAFKTACMLGYWGHWRQARKLTREFTHPGSWKLDYYLPALVCGTPAGSVLGNLARRLTNR